MAGLIHSSATTLVTLLQATGRSKTGELAGHVDAFPFFAVNRVHYMVDGNKVVLLERSVPLHPCFSLQRTLWESVSLFDAEELGYRVAACV
jgi:hypothetical protein